MTGREPSAARRYKEVVAGITAAAEGLREHDRDRAAALARELEHFDDEMRSVAERAALTRVGVELAWEAALEALWVESWMKLRPRPGPDPRGEPAELAALDVDVEQRTAELLAAVHRRRFGLRR